VGRTNTISYTVKLKTQEDQSLRSGGRGKWEYNEGGELVQSATVKMHGIIAMNPPPLLMYINSKVK
jgi:hypothetical protein